VTPDQARPTLSSKPFNGVSKTTTSYSTFHLVRHPLPSFSLHFSLMSSPSALSFVNSSHPYAYSPSCGLYTQDSLFHSLLSSWLTTNRRLLSEIPSPSSSHGTLAGNLNKLIDKAKSSIVTSYDSTGSQVSTGKRGMKGMLPSEGDPNVANQKDLMQLALEEIGSQEK
jgi:hypothetical protein